MKTSVKVESYLAEFDAALGKIPVSAKAEILIETKKKILDAIEKSPTQNIDTLLAEFGSPEKLARQILLEKGLQPVANKSPKILKWLVLGFFGLGFISIVTFVLAFQFMTPFMELNEETGQVAFLGGLIELDDMNGSFHFGQTQIEDGVATSSHEGSRLLKGTSIEELQVDFSNGRFVVDNGPDGSLSWSCQAKNLAAQRFFSETTSRISFDFASASGIDCDLKIPVGLKVFFKGANGKLTFERPNYPIDVEIQNGIAILAPDAQAKYRYDLSVVNGTLDEFDNSSDEDALLIRISVANGKIQNAYE